MKLKNFNYDETKKKSNFDWTQNLKLKQNSKTKIVTKLKLWQNSNSDQTQNVAKLKLW